MIGIFSFQFKFSNSYAIIVSFHFNFARHASLKNSQIALLLVDFVSPSLRLAQHSLDVVGNKLFLKIRHLF